MSVKYLENGEYEFDSDIVIGLEIHVTMNTASKLFCACANKSSDEPNINVCPVCLGHPGTRPLLNKKALEYSIKLAKALNCEIAPRLIFSRKTYFYPDLSKNFQTTQFEEPLGKNGFVIVKMDSGDKQIGLERIHMEEDPGALVHKGNGVLIDYNRSGSPLCEIVTKPEIESPKEAREFIKKLMTIINYTDVFDINNGTFKADLNVSIRESGYKRVEIKGVSGFKDIQDAIEYEVARQQEEPDEIVQETRGYDNVQKVTFSQRKKEGAEDYGYIYEPDLVPRDITPEMIKGITQSMPEMVDSRIARYVKDGMKENDAEIIASSREVSDLFDKAINSGAKFDSATKFFRREIMTAINDGKFSYSELYDDHISSQLLALLKLFSDRKINNHSVLEILEKLAEDKKIDINKYANDNKLIVESNLDLDAICKDAIANSQAAVDDYKSGNEKALNYVVGQVMKVTKGGAMPDEVKAKLKEIIG